jgi:GNAT superfamily N-acetyltransferase
MMEIRSEVRENVLSDPSKVTPELVTEYLESRGRGWVWEERGRVVGFVVAERSTATIWALFLRPQAEGRGIGTALLGLAVEWLFTLGHDSVSLRTEAGTRADRFYAARGWERGALDGQGEVGFVLRRSPAV